MDPLAPFGNSSVHANTNLSTSISLSILDQNGNYVSILVSEDQPIQFFVPRDPNTPIPSMNLQNVTSMNSTSHNQVFYLNYLNITSTLAISIHFEMQSFDTNLSYLFIYKFDQAPQLNSSINLIDGWTLFCSSSKIFFFNKFYLFIFLYLDLSDDNLFKYFINNQLTPNHQTLVFGLRELNETEVIQYCSDNSSINNLPITDAAFNFTSNYELRVYTSGCYYLDSTNNWQSDGIVVSVFLSVEQR
jgi:hypothetical protein